MITITVTGPSGSGKDSLVDGLLYVVGAKPLEELTPFVASHAKELDAMKVSCLRPNSLSELISHTTRAMRAGEVDGKDYYFVTKDEFQKIPKVEESNYAGNNYCLSKAAIDNCKTKVGIVIVDINGKLAVEEYVGESRCMSIYIEVAPDVIEERMRLRGDSEESIKTRLKNAQDTHEFENGKYCKVTIRNDDYVAAVRAGLDILLQCGGGIGNR